MITVIKKSDYRDSHEIAVIFFPPIPPFTLFMADPPYIEKKLGLGGKISVIKFFKLP